MSATKRQLLPIFGVVAAVTLLGIIVVYVAGLRVTRANLALLQREQMRDILEDTLSSLRNAEADQRGFLLTGQEEYLEPYRVALTRIDENLHEIERWGRAGAMLAEQAEAIIRLIRANLERLDRNIQLRRQEGLDAAVAAVRSGVGLRLMEELRQQIGQIQVRQAAKTLAIRQQRDRASQLRTISAAFMALVTVLFVGWAYWRTRRMFAAQLQAAEAIRASEQRFRSFFNSAAVGTAQIAPDGRLLEVNDRYCQITGYSREELLGKSPIELSPPDAREADREVLDRFLCGQTPIYKIEKRFRRKDGSIVWVHVSAAMTHDATGRPLCASGIIQDITERKVAEERLRESELRFRALVMASSDVVYRMNPDWSEMRQLRGRDFIPDTETPSRTWLQKYIHPDDQPHVMAVINQAIRTRSIFELEHRVVRVDGSLGWTFSRAIPIANGSSEVVEWFGTASDITRRKQAEEALRESEQRLRVAQQAARIGSFEWNIQTGVNTWSPELEAMYGLQSGEFAETEAAWEQLVHPEDRASAIALANRALETGQPVEGEWRICWPDGSVHWLLGRCQVLKDATGQPLRLTGVNLDITERKTAEARLAEELAERTRAEAALRQSEERFRTMADAIPQLAWIANADGWIHWYNRRWYEYTGTTPRQMAGWGWQSVHDPEVLPRVLERWKASIATGEPLDMDFPLRGADGEFRRFLTRVIPLKDTQGRVVQWFGTNTDVEALKRAEEAVRQANQTLEEQVQQRTEALAAATRSAEQAKARAEQATAAKDHFLAVLSHELRTPLTPVLATVSMLQQNSPGDADLHEDLDVIRRNVELEARLIDDLLDVTRIVRGKVELDRRPIELCTILRRAVEVCQPDIESRQLDFGIDLGPDAPFMVQADAGRLQQVFWNLLKNAIKFTPHGGCVGVRCCRDGNGQVVVTINDSGMGIDPNAIPGLFNAFEQGDRGVTRQFGGLGLGLTISKAMVEMHGGSITAHSEGKNKGATFTVHLPLMSVGAAKPAPRQPILKPERQARPLRILLVEDHGDTAKVMRRLLQADGHEVQIAGDVATALELAGKTEFDLLLSDLGLPDASGLDLMRTLRARGSTLPGIALSGYGQDQDIAASRGAGFATHVTKPVDLAQLEDAIAATMGVPNYAIS